LVQFRDARDEELAKVLSGWISAAAASFCLKAEATHDLFIVLIQHSPG
jgi:hypothetical protein